jgi:DNA-binding transcriptional regulator YbjK
MTNDRRRSGALGWVLLVAGLGAMAAGAAWRATTRPPGPDLVASGAAAHVRIEEALASQARALEPAASAATVIPALIAALDMGADRDTFQDLLENEEWWAPLRSGYPLTAVLMGAEPLAVLGTGPKDLDSLGPVHAARERGLASGIVARDGLAYAIAAARVARNKNTTGPTPVVVLGARLDQAALARVSQLTGDALGLSAGGRLVEVAGPGEPGRVLAPLVSHEAAPPGLLEDGREGTAWAIGGGMWILAAFVPARAPGSPPNVAALALVVGGAVTALGAIVWLAIGWAARSSGDRQRRPGSQGGATSAAVAKSQRAFAPTEVVAPTPSVRPSVGPEGALPRDGVPPAASEKGPAVAPFHAASDSRRIGDAGPAGDPNVAHRNRTRQMPDANVSPLALATAPAEIGPGSQMGRYRLIERIGEGGMAEIFFAAAHGAADFVRYFVVKRMHPHVARHRDAVNQFIDEAQLQARLVHSNIVPVFDFGKAGTEYFLALEYIHGKDLGQLTRAHIERFHRPLGLAVAFYIIHEVLEALAFAHSQVDKDGSAMAVVHRDVAPGNVLVSYRGEVKLTDFGIAKSERRISHTEVGMVKGNANFMSPEQARGEVVDHRSDIFSAGLVLYYCLTGEPLYNESTFNRLIRAAVGPDTAQFGQIGQLAPIAARVLGNALGTNPAERYATASDFARDVAPHVAARGELVALIDQVFPSAERRDLR